MRIGPVLRSQDVCASVESGIADDGHILLFLLRPVCMRFDGAALHSITGLSARSGFSLGVCRASGPVRITSPRR
jgi:hypothetical protein